MFTSLPLWLSRQEDLLCLEKRCGGTQSQPALESWTLAQFSQGWQACQDWTCPVLSHGTKWAEGWGTQTGKPRGKKQTPFSNLDTSGIPVVASVPSPP